MSVTAAEGLRRRRLPCRHQAAALRHGPARDRGRPAGAVRRRLHAEQVRAPPVELDRATLAANGGKAAAVIVNSGNANAGPAPRATRTRS